MDFQTLADLSELAAQAYDNDGTPVAGRLPEGWRSVDLGLSTDADGYFQRDFNGQAFVAADDATHQVALVFRGTEPATGVDEAVDLSILIGALGVAAAAFEDVVQAAEGYASGLGYSLLTAGHSLGGALAETIFTTHLGIAGGVGTGSPGLGPIPFLGPHSGDFVHVTRAEDPVGTYAPAAHPGITLTITDNEFSPLPTI